MDGNHIALVASLHASRILTAREREASAVRCGELDPERATRCWDDAAQCRAEAAAIAALLKAAGADVLIPEPGQLSLFGDGQ